MTIFDDPCLAKSTLDQLFHETARYRGSTEYQDLLEFVGRFPQHAPYNAFLLHIQNPSARFVLNPNKWREEYERTIINGARPMVILVPFGPVDFVYDAADTEGKALPAGLLDPFMATGVVPRDVWHQSFKNCTVELVFVEEVMMESNQAGKISNRVSEDRAVALVAGKTEKGEVVYENVAARYHLTLNRSHNRTTQYATLVHELAHLYCGHLGTPNPKWWPDRTGFSHEQQEFEAESVAYLVCTRIGIDNPSARYLSGYYAANDKIPSVSLELIFKVAGHIERMGRAPLKPRKWA